MNTINNLLPAVVVVPIVVKAARLLAEFNPQRVPIRAKLLPAWEFTPRANKITKLLEGILANRGWNHAGLND